MGKVQARICRALTLYVRQLAWLYAVPQPPKGTKQAEKGEPNTLSRFDQMRRGNVTPQMPPCPMPHFIEWFTDIGMVESGGMGPAPLSWREISEWQANMAVTLEPWEAKLLRELSVAYLSQKGNSECTLDPPPWTAGVTQSEREADEAAIDAVLG